jgi:hypothetical protein
VLEITDTTVLIESEKTKIRLDKSAVNQSGEELLQAK